MATKSIAQRIVEVIAIVMVLAVATPLVIAVGGRLWPQLGAEPQGKGKSPKPVAKAKSQPGPEPVRPAVDSVEKLPPIYPAIAEVVLDTSSPPPSKLPAAKPESLHDIRIRHLNAFATGEVRLLEPDGRLAIVDEITPAKTHRLAVWDLETGKLLRFLASEPKPTWPFQGQENADFGSKIDFDSFSGFAVAPSGKRFAARQGMGAVKQDISAYAWEVATGQLLCRWVESGVHDIFLYPHDDYLVLNQACGQRDHIASYPGHEDQPSVARYPDVALLRVDVHQGEADLLTPVGVGVGLTGRGTNRGGLITFTSAEGLHTIDIATRQHLQGAPLETPVGFTYLCMWITPDGSRLHACTLQANLDTWDLQSLERTRTTRLKTSGNPSPVLGAADAGLLVLHDGKSRIANVVEAETAKVVSVVQLPFRTGRVKAISSDARRLIVSTDQTSLLVVDFPQRLPDGVIDLGQVLVKQKLPATR